MKDEQEKIKELESQLHVLNRQFKNLITHLGYVVERGPNQMGADDCVGVWAFRPVCEKCGK